LISSTSHAFDGKRKGFVLGGGIGFSPSGQVNWSMPRIEASGTTVVVDVVAGHGFSERDLLLLELHVVPHGLKGMEGLTMVHEFFGLTWRHHFGRGTRSLFSQIGAGEMVLHTFDTRRDHPADLQFDHFMRSAEVGWGATLGLGYHFLKHFTISGNWWVGSFSHEDGGRVHQSIFDFTTSILLF
jgi:hypothetical protein